MSYFTHLGSDDSQCAVPTKAGYEWVITDPVTCRGYWTRKKATSGPTVTVKTFSGEITPPTMDRPRAGENTVTSDRQTTTRDSRVSAEDRCRKTGMPEELIPACVEIVQKTGMSPDEAAQKLQEELQKQANLPARQPAPSAPTPGGLPPIVWIGAAAGVGLLLFLRGRK